MEGGVNMGNKISILIMVINIALITLSGAITVYSIKRKIKFLEDCLD